MVNSSSRTLDSKSPSPEVATRQRLLLPLLLAVLLTLLFLPFLKLQGQLDVSQKYPRPKLILVLVIDQFRYDYLVRFRPLFVQGGFNLLLSGANFVDCRYDYATTVTGPGHATLFTGAYPNVHGIIENKWYDSSLHRDVYCVEDASTKVVGGQGSGASPRNLIGSTFGDELRFESDFQSKVISISLKDRAAVLPGGHTANAAYWYDSKTGHFVSSTYYMQSLPSWAAQFNEQSPAKAYCGKAWQALPETPGAAGRILEEFKPTANKPCPDTKFLGWLDSTPFMNEVELNFADEAVRNEGLGQGSATDLLAVSLSVNDSVGHGFGPYSPEVADTTLRTDRYLAEFFKKLNQKVSLDNVWIALSADHGVAPNPRFIKDSRLGMGNARLIAVRKAAEQALSRVFGEDQWIEAMDEFYLYLDHRTLEKHHVEAAKAEAIAAEAADSAPGVSAAFTRTQLLSGTLASTPLARKALNSFNRHRGGDIFLALEPYAVPVEGDIETAHGSAWNYDAQVPLVLWGKPIKSGSYVAPCQPTDLAPTLAAALGISQPSGGQGRPLAEALK